MLIIPFVIANLIKPIPPPPPKYIEVVTLHLETTQLKTTENLPQPLAQPIEAPKEMVLAPIASVASNNLYTPGNCTWYVKNLRPDIPNSWGDAISWLYNAQAIGWPTGAVPRVGAVGWRPGHVMVIIAVNGDGTVRYTDMNGRYILYEIGYYTVPAGNLTYIY